MKNRIFAILLFVFVAGVLHGREYDRFNVGLKFGATWSPQKAYSVHKNPSVWLPDEGEFVPIEMDGGRQIGLTIGVEGRWNLTPGRLRLALGSDYIRPIANEAKKNAANVTQDILRNQLRLIISGRTNTQPGIYSWIGPTFSRVMTESKFPITSGGGDEDDEDDPVDVRNRYSATAPQRGAIPKTSENVWGFGVGIGKQRFMDTHLFHYELGIYYQQKSNSSKSGDFTIEFRTGWHW
jgi:hypothetical protein